MVIRLKQINSGIIQNKYKSLVKTSTGILIMWSSYKQKVTIVNLHNMLKTFKLLDLYPEEIDLKFGI